MAVFWKHIKGTGNATNNETGLWSWINWSTEDPILDQGDRLDADSRTMSWAPKIMCNNRNTAEDIVELGHIITSKNKDQKIETLIDLPEVFLNMISLERYHSLSFCSTNPDNGVGFMLTAGDDDIIDIDHKGTIRSEGLLQHSGEIQNNGDVIITEGKCEAQYFNAISDKRAKENICPLMSSALDIINAVQVYTFNYKNSDKTTIGVIAQEVLPYNLDGVTFVSNPDATGKDDDYMSITESKLVYLLLKGMQEQQEQINQLKQRILDLEGK